jgi:hypothetical protein
MEKSGEQTTSREVGTAKFIIYHSQEGGRASVLERTWKCGS